MKSGSYSSILRIVLHGRSAGKILLATLLSFTFSIAVILCTFGLMDGFDHLLKTGLRHSSGDLLVTNRRGFFVVDHDLSDSLHSVHPLALAKVIQTEAFALGHGMSKGVLVRGVDESDFNDATGLKLRLENQKIVIGKELARQLKVGVGDDLALTLGRGNDSSGSLPSVKVFKISQIITHGIYQKDLRFVYVPRSDLSELLSVGEKVNLIILAVTDVTKPLKDLEQVQKIQQDLRSHLTGDFLTKPFWSEYSFLIEAVKVEKFSISLILQLIVVVAVFNIIAFVIYIMEKKAQDFFFLRAVGLSVKSLMKFWLVSVLLIWICACAGAHLFSIIFNWGLGYFPFLQIPGDIYVLSSIQIKLDIWAYLTVYLISLFWVLLAAFVGYWRLKRRPIIEGLRQEFSS